MGASDLKAMFADSPADMLILKKKPKVFLKTLHSNAASDTALNGLERLEALR